MQQLLAEEVAATSIVCKGGGRADDWKVASPLTEVGFNPPKSNEEPRLHAVALRDSFQQSPIFLQLRAPSGNPVLTQHAPQVLVQRQGELWLVLVQLNDPRHRLKAFQHVVHR